MDFNEIQKLIDIIKKENPEMVFSVSWNVNTYKDVIENVYMSLSDKTEEGNVCGQD